MLPARMASDIFTRLVLFPGLGSDGRFYPFQKSLPVNLQTPSWIEPESDRESLTHYAERMAEQVRGEGKLYVGGVSLGAVVALEAARYLDVSGVLMVSGCRSGRDLSPLFQLITAAASSLPRQWVRPVIALGGPPGFWMLERLPLSLVRLMTTMMLRQSPRQVRWSARALLEWKSEGDPPAPVHSLHGALDEVIPLRNVSPEEIVPGGRHLLHLSRAAEANEFLCRAMGIACRAAPGG